MESSRGFAGCDHRARGLCAHAEAAGAFDRSMPPPCKQHATPRALCGTNSPGPWATRGFTQALVGINTVFHG